MLEGEFPGVLQAAARGDEVAFARLWRDAHPHLMRYLMVIAGDAAEDVAAEVWLGISRRLPSFQGDEREFRGWLFTLARRRAADHRRYSRRHPAWPTGEHDDLDRPSSDDTAATVMDSISTEAALKLIGTLPRNQAEIITLRVVAGLDVAQVAQITGKRPGTIRVAAHRGLRTLAARLSVRTQRGRGVTR